MPAVPAPIAPPAAIPNLAAAIEDLNDEDEEIRKKAAALVDSATTADLLVMEPYEKAENPEIRRRVGLVLLRLRRQDVVFQLAYPDGAPAAGLSVGVQLSAIAPETNSLVVVHTGNLTTDADGKCAVGCFNPGAYQYQILLDAPLPPQRLLANFTLEAKSAPVKIVVCRGINPVLTVVDDANRPISEVLILLVSADQLANFKQMAVANVLNTRTSRHAFTDKQGVAKLGNVQAAQLAVVAAHREYALACLEPHTVKDGATVALTIKMTKATPLNCCITALDNQGAPLPGLRILLVPLAMKRAVMGADFANAGMVKNDPADYLKKGATDVGTADDLGVCQAKLYNGQYLVLGFGKDGKTWHFSLFGNSPIQNALTLRFNPAKQPE